MKIKYFGRLLAAAVLLSTAACGSESPGPAEQKPPEPQQESNEKQPHWSYEGDTGPDKWADIDSSYSKCADGTEQSPIDIELANVKLDKTLEDININYKTTAFTVMNNGHTIQANDASGSNTILADGVEYKLVQMHFHKPSEHQFNGKNFEMEGHLVHKNDEGKLAVLGFLIKAGNENKVLAEMWSKLPSEKTEADITLENSVDLDALLPKEKKSFRYSGSLTTPPCSEGVKWIVMEQPIEMSKEQIAAFGTIFPNNSRPVQPLNEREVSEIQP